MLSHTELQTALVRFLLTERRADAAREGLARQGVPRDRHPAGIRSRIGRRLIAAGAAIAREGLVEDSGEPIAHTMGSPSLSAGRPDPCLDPEPRIVRAA
jgi:hypothetical protein